MSGEMYTLCHMRPKENVQALELLIENNDPLVSRVETKTGMGYKITEEPDGKGRYLIFDETGCRSEYRIKSGKVRYEAGRPIDMTATYWAIHLLTERYLAIEEKMKEEPIGGFAPDELCFPNDFHSLYKTNQAEDQMSEPAHKTNQAEDQMPKPARTITDWLDETLNGLHITLLFLILVVILLILTLIGLY